MNFLSLQTEAYYISRYYLFIQRSNFLRPPSSSSAIVSETKIRWRHELRRFEPLNVLSFGDHGWHFQGATGAEFQAGDVMLCDFSLMPLLLRGSERDILAQFTTLTIDSRSPLKDGGVSLASDVMSSKWWKNLLRAFSSSACLGPTNF